MPRTTKTITFSLPPDMMTQIDKLMKEEGRKRSELLREALRHYAEQQQWKRTYRYGEMKAREKGITEEDVDKLIHARRIRRGQTEVGAGQ